MSFGGRLRPRFLKCDAERAQAQGPADQGGRKKKVKEIVPNHPGIAGKLQNSFEPSRLLGFSLRGIFAHRTAAI
jgi:hypothetical protein